MHFIISRFFRMIACNYKLNYSMTKLQDGSYMCTINGIPEGLTKKLIKLTYSHAIGQKDIYGKNNKFIRTDTISEEINVCDPIYYPNKKLRGISIVFTENCYAIKCNKLDYELRRYYENHSLIDQINHKG